MNLKNTSGSLAVETARLNRELPVRLGPLFRHSLSAIALATADETRRVNLHQRPNRAAEELHTFPATFAAGARSIRVPLPFVATSALKTEASHKSLNVYLGIGAWFIVWTLVLGHWSFPHVTAASSLRSLSPTPDALLYPSHSFAPSAVNFARKYLISPFFSPILSARPASIAAVSLTPRLQPGAFDLATFTQPFQRLANSNQMARSTSIKRF